MYKCIRAPAFGETLTCEVEFGNIHDSRRWEFGNIHNPSVVPVRKPGVGESSFETVGHFQENFCSVSFFHNKSRYYHFIIISMITPYTCNVQIIK